VRITILGAGREIGRSAILISVSNTVILLDYGVLMKDKQPDFPSHVPPKDLDVIVLTHAHLDHSGALPMLYVSEKKPIYMTKLTAELVDILIRDLLRLSSYFLPYEVLELRSMLSNVLPVNYGDEVQVKEVRIKFFDAGHIPGSLMVLIEAEGKRVLYTGDFNVIPTRLLKAARIDLPELDAVITEATYVDVDHPDRGELEERFVSDATEVVEGGGIVLVPAFSVGRSQEMLCVLAAHYFGYDVYLDGMAREVSRIFLKYPDFFRDYGLLERAIRSTLFIGSRADRRKACSKPGVIVTPAGMLKGGPAVHYMNRLAKDERNAIFLVSYQVPGTPGHNLLNTGKYAFGNRLEKVKALVKWYDFSSHLDKTRLLNFLNSLKGGPKVFMIHGEGAACEAFAKDVVEKTGLEVKSPINGESFNL